MTKKIVKIDDQHKGQFQYLGRWVDKKAFRAFVYDKDGKQQLANSHDEFEKLIETGLWFATRPDTLKRSKKDVVCTTS